MIRVRVRVRMEGQPLPVAGVWCHSATTLEWSRQAMGHGVEVRVGVGVGVSVGLGVGVGLIKGSLHLTKKDHVIHFYARLYIYIHIYTHIHIYTYTHIHIYAYTHIRIYTYTHIHIYTYTHIHIYTYTHIHIYTYTRTCDRFFGRSAQCGPAARDQKNTFGDPQQNASSGVCVAAPGTRGRQRAQTIGSMVTIRAVRRASAACQTHRAFF